MLKKLVRCNDKLALEIDSPILESLAIDEDTPLIVRQEGNFIVIQKSKYEQISDNPRVQAMFEEVTEQYSEDFAKLGKT